MADDPPEYCSAFRRMINASCHLFDKSPLVANEGVAVRFNSWLCENQEAQAVIACVLLVVCVWWLLKAIVSVIINLVLPVFVGLLFVMFVPPIREALLGDHGLTVAGLLRSALLRLADMLK